MSCLKLALSIHIYIYFRFLYSIDLIHFWDWFWLQVKNGKGAMNYFYKKIISISFFIKIKNKLKPMTTIILMIKKFKYIQRCLYDLPKISLLTRSFNIHFKRRKRKKSNELKAIVRYIHIQSLAGEGSSRILSLTHSFLVGSKTTLTH